MKRIKKLVSFIVSALEHIFLRKRLFEYSFYAGTTNFKQVLSIIKAKFKGEPLQDGEYISAYEKAFRDYLGAKYSWSFATGRMGLYVILKALNIQEEDEIIVPAYTCVVVINSIIYAGCKPVYVDINAKTFNIDIAKIEEKITPKTKALYAQHTFGLMCDIEAMQKIAAKYNLPIIEDCCLALGAEAKGKKAGTFGTIAYFSTDHSKVISTSSGGMVVTNDDLLAKRITQLYRQTPFCSKKLILKILFAFIIEDILRAPSLYFWGKYLLYFFNRIGVTFFFTDYNRLSKPTDYPFPARLSNLQAMLGLDQLRQLETIIQHHRKIARKYDEKLNIYSNYFEQNSKEHIFLRYVFLVEDPSVWKKATEKYLEIESWFSSIAQGRRDNFEEIYYTTGTCLIADWVSKHVINLPTHLKVRKPERIIEMLEKLLKAEHPDCKVLRENMKTPKVSVIIPTYNSEQFIGETLDSVFNQNYQNFEVIVVDDGSCDGTDKVISGYKDRLTYIRKKNEGISIARNTAIAVARGEYIAFIDHDDIWVPEKLKEQIALLEDNKAIGLCFSDAYIIDEKGRRGSSLFKICPPYSGMVFKKLLKENFIPVPTAIVRKDIFKEVGLFNPQHRITEDWDLFLRISERYPVAFINRPLAGYRVHTGSFSQRRDLMLEEAIAIINKYITLVDKTAFKTLTWRRCRFQFALGMTYLHKGMRKKARDYFLTRVKEKPFSFGFYLGVFMTYLPDSSIKFVGRISSSKALHGLKYT